MRGEILNPNKKASTSRVTFKKLYNIKVSMTDLATPMPESLVFLLPRLRLSLHQEKGLGQKLYRTEMIPALKIRDRQNI